MLFYWSGDQVMIKRGRIPEGTSPSEWTTFDLQMREPGAIPDMKAFGSFLAKLFSATENVSEVQVWMKENLPAQSPPSDSLLNSNHSHPLSSLSPPSQEVPLPSVQKDICLLHLSKQLSESQIMSVPLNSGLTLPLYTPNRVFAITKAEIKEVLILVKSTRIEIPPPPLAELGVTIATAALSSMISQPVMSNLKKWWFGGNSSTPDPSPVPSPSSPITPKEQQAELKVTEFQVSLKMVSAYVAVNNLRSATVAEMERVTKKKPPSYTHIKIIFSENETDFEDDKLPPSSSNYSKKKLSLDSEEVFYTLDPFPSRGVIFIGFPTQQTTGSSLHIAAHLIPTVERESIDFVDETLKAWNSELLSACGMLDRFIFEHRLETLMNRFRPLSSSTSSVASLPPPLSRRSLMRRAAHILSAHNFVPSTPSPTVAKILLEYMFRASTIPPRLPTLMGLRPCNQVRLTLLEDDEITDENEKEDLSPSPPSSSPLSSLPLKKRYTSLKHFIRTVPLVPDRLVKESSGFFTILQQRNLIQFLSINDLFTGGYLIVYYPFLCYKKPKTYVISFFETELSTRPLDSEEEFIALLRFWLRSLKIMKTIPVGERGNYPGLLNVQPEDRNKLVQLTKVKLSATSPSSAEGAAVPSPSVPLTKWKYFLNTQVIPGDLPLPDSVVPLSITKHLSRPEMENELGIWQELPLNLWAVYIFKLSQFETEKDFVENVLATFSKAFSNFKLDDLLKAEIISLLTTKKCVPTSFGMQLPGNCYFRNVTLFSDLPIVSVSSKHISKQFLQMLGVREHVDLQLVFSRLGKRRKQFFYLSIVVLLALAPSILTLFRLFSIEDLNWDTQKLIKYLSSVKDKFTESEWKKLSESELVLVEGDPTQKRHKVLNVFVPKQKLHILGLPTLAWPKSVVSGSTTVVSEKFKKSQPERILLHQLGMKRFPDLQNILNLIIEHNSRKVRKTQQNVVLSPPLFHLFLHSET
jgi:hypothetical protein